MQPMFERTLSRDCDPAAWADGRLVIFAACDMAYLDNALVLLRSLDLMSPGFDFLLHVINPHADVLESLQRVGDGLVATRLHLSAEKVRVVDAGHKRPYYASARFIRLAELLPRTEVPFLVLDADGLFVAPIDLNFSDKQEAEICLRRRDIEGESEERLKVAAGAVWVRPTPQTVEFFAAVRDDLVGQFRSGEPAWFMDQIVIAQHVAQDTGNAAVRNIKHKYADWSFRDNAIIWTGKGDRKYFDVRYLLLRLGFDGDPERRLRARRLLHEVVSMIPIESQGQVGAHAIKVLHTISTPRIAIYLPRLDLPWKKSGMSKGGPPAPSPDTIELRLWWKRFTMELSLALTRYGIEPKLMEIPAWDITPERVDEDDLDLAFIPHRCQLDFESRATPVLFYMQEYFRPVFVVDSGGWSAASSVYPVDAGALPPAVLGAWDDYRARFAAGELASKFGQSGTQAQAELLAAGKIPATGYAFFPLQIPHDQSLAYFSDVSEMQALEAVAAWAVRAGIPLVLKEHPANRASMAEFRARFNGPGIVWSDAHVHDLLRHARGVITLNSGVGFEALIAGRPLVTLARSEYDAVGFKATPMTLAESWDLALAEDGEQRMQRYARFVDWFLARHAVDLSRPVAARYVLDRIIASAVTMARTKAIAP